MSSLSRRSFLSSPSLGGVFVVPLAAGCATAPPASQDLGRPIPPPAAAPPPPDSGSTTRDLVLQVNGRPQALRVDVRTTLLDALRDGLGMTGTKKGCDQGQCGACTVHVDGRRVLSCLTLASSVGDRPVTTIEGLAGADGSLHPMQQAFVDHDAFQCGYCTPGQIMSAVACVAEGHADSPETIREFMSGNLCRCAAYPKIVAAIVQAKPAMTLAGSAPQSGEVSR